jgi:hypothetical protein
MADFDWESTGLPETFWRQVGAEVGASEIQILFAAAYSLKEVSASEALRRAGSDAKGNALKTAAYRLSRSVAVEELLGRAKAERAGDNKDGTVDATEARRILSRLARNSDPSVKIRAIESLLKLDEADLLRAREEQQHRDPVVALRELAEAAPELAWSLAADAGFDPDILQIPPPDKARLERQDEERAIAWIRRHPKRAVEWARHSAGVAQETANGQ